MNRTYSNGDTANNVDFFVGIEVEHSPAYGKQTLFVTGVQHPQTLLDNVKNHNCKHVYLGANMSFNLDNSYDLYAQDIAGWASMFDVLQDNNIWFTLDFQANQIGIVTDEGLGEYTKFIAMISVRLPYITQLGYNACIKLDDRDFDDTNPGVWVHRLHNLQDPDAFTSWNDYKNDTPTSKESKA